MTSKQRLLAAMRCEKPDHTPCAPFGLGRLSPDSAMARELIAGTDPFLVASVGGNPFIGRKIQFETRESDKCTEKRLQTSKGELIRRIEHTEKTSATVEYPLKNLDDMEEFLSLLYEPPQVDPARYFAYQQKINEEGLVLTPIPNAVAFAASWFGPEQFCLLWATAPQEIIRLTKIMNERVKQYVEICCSKGVTQFRIVGGEYVSVQLGPQGMPDLIRKPDRELIDLIHAHDGIAFYHNHGPMMAFLEDYAYIGVDFLEPMEAPPWGDVDLCEAARQIDGRYCMVGNLDDMEIIEKYDQAEVERIACERLQQASGTDGFVLGGTASGTYTEKAARNFIAMAEVAKRNG